MWVAAGPEATLCGVGASITGATARQAAKHLACSIPPPQQSSAGMVIVMLSHGRSAAAWTTEAMAEPKASQNDRSAKMSVRSLMRGG